MTASDTLPQPYEGALNDRLALVTGASRGIGRAVAEAYGAAGAHVLLVARTQGALEEVDDAIKAKGGSATIVPLDIADNPDGINYMAGQIAERWRKLDIVVGNAAILGPLSPLSHINGDDWDKLINTNIIPNTRLIRACNPLLRQSDAGRMIMVSSSVSVRSEPFWGGYGATKAMLDYITQTYAAENETTNINANIVDPGGTRTKMRAQAKPGEDPMTLPTPEDIAPLFVRLAMKECTANGQRFKARDYLDLSA